MRFPTVFSLLLLLVNLAQASSVPQSDTYHYRLDLREVENDQLTVELIAPVIREKTIRFYMPKIIPGTYTIYDFGRFVSGLEAFDRDGRSLPVRSVDVNTWEISEARDLYRLTYRVDDTFDAADDNPVSGMSGTNIEAGKNFLLNGHGFFGYFEGMKEQTFELTVRKPEGFYGSTPMRMECSSPGADCFRVSNYFHLVDNPLMYCRPDTVNIRVGRAEVLVSVYSPGGAVTAEYIAERYERLLQAQEAYLGGDLPVDRYAFLMYFFDPSAAAIPTGALEHNYSSVYCLPDMPQEQIIQFLVDIAAHEFFHIVTPLNIHSREIHYFDFNGPKMSRHLWMYEGATEYFSHHAQLTQGLIGPEDFLQVMGQKVQQSKSLYDDDLAFTDLSRQCLDKHAHEYGNVYEKGALINLCLDLVLHRSSGGAYGLVDLMSDLSEKFGKERPFRDPQLFRAIGQLGGKEARRFLKKYVAGDRPIPYEEYFAMAGISYEPPRDSMVFSLGGVSLGFNQETQRLFVANTYSLNEFGRALGYRVGDELLAINGKTLPSNNFGPYFQELMGNLQEGKTFLVEVSRPTNEGGMQKVELSAPVVRVRQLRPPTIAIDPEASPEQVRLRQAWMGG
ncbi:MAG: hypothetical protein KDC30_15115 [Saprospiraceae bacterium]|nr:hypothetical protein [Saprospiraceae bacterium]